MEFLLQVLFMMIKNVKMMHSDRNSRTIATVRRKGGGREKAVLLIASDKNHVPWKSRWVEQEMRKIQMLGALYLTAKGK